MLTAQASTYCFHIRLYTSMKTSVGGRWYSCVYSPLLSPGCIFSIRAVQHMCTLQHCCFRRPLVAVQCSHHQQAVRPSQQHVQWLCLLHAAVEDCMPCVCAYLLVTVTCQR